LNIIKKHTKKTLLTDSIYISAGYDIIRRYNRLSIVSPDDGII
jgi:hypothetical protein